ncbi:MAG: hypothetical protein ABIQ12_00920 [Opitutaceae bacterium]
MITGAGSSTVFIRAIGPGLGGVWRRWHLAVTHHQDFQFLRHCRRRNDNWRATDPATFAQVGAFPLRVNSKDAFVIATLATCFGVSAANLPVILPDICRFAQPNLDFMG